MPGLLHQPLRNTALTSFGCEVGIRSDCQHKYDIPPCLAETFIERERFAGVCYRAANWLWVGQTFGRSRLDRDHTVQVPVKDIYLYPLCNDFKERLCA